MNHQRFKTRRRGLQLGVDSISEIDIEKLKRCRSPSLGASNEELRQNLLKLDDENIRQHLAIICKCFIARRLKQNDLRVKYNYMFVSRELDTLEEMALSLQVAYPGTFCRKIYPISIDEAPCCANHTLCRLFRIMFDNDGGKMTWFKNTGREPDLKFAASLEILNLVSNYTTRQSLIHQYGRLTTLTNEYMECITKHSPIIPFVQRETWSELENYFRNKKQEAKSTSQQSKQLDMIRLKELYDFYSEKYRAEANFVFILSMVFIILTMLKMVLSQDANKIHL